MPNMTKDHAFMLTQGTNTGHILDSNTQKNSVANLFGNIVIQMNISNLTLKTNVSSRFKILAVVMSKRRLYDWIY